LSLFAGPLRERFLLTGVESDLDAAITVAAEAVSRARDGETLFNLGMALWLRHERDMLAVVDSVARDAAVAAFEDCVRSTGTAPLVRAAAAAYQARLHAEQADWSAADASYAVALGLLPVLTGRQLGWDSRHAQLGRLAGLGVDAAAVAVRRGDPERAVAILEASRGVLLRQSIEQRSAADEVRLQAGDLADQFRSLALGLADEFDRLSAQLSVDTAASTEFDADPASMADPAVARREIAAGWERVIGRIRREVPGLARFCAPLRFGDLAPAAARGPVVVVNVSRFGCDALIVRESRVRVVPLPELSHDEVRRQVERFVQAVEAANGETDAVVCSTLDWLLKTTTTPVLDVLGPDTGRVWWMPTGVLAALPLPAAASLAPNPPHLVSSTTTTLRALVHAYARPVVRITDARAVVVAMSETPARPLPRATEEAAAVAALIGGRVEVLSDGHATPRAVSTALADASVAHFCCHALADLTDPASGALTLAGGRLSVRDIAKLPRNGRVLAYLSACTTALTGGRLVDEGMHIGSGFQFAGFPTVIGTLWRIDDDVARDVAEGFYRSLRSDPDPAVALHVAVRELRDRYPNRPVLWGAFVHIGQ
jgi:CHAT domain-containing protein